jgi:hypothetical protein
VPPHRDRPDALMDPHVPLCAQRDPADPVTVGDDWLPDPVPGESLEDAVTAAIAREYRRRIVGGIVTGSEGHARAFAKVARAAQARWEVHPEHEIDVGYWPTCTVCHGPLYLTDDEKWGHA